MYVATDVHSRTHVWRTAPWWNGTTRKRNAIIRDETKQKEQLVVKSMVTIGSDDRCDNHQRFNLQRTLNGTLSLTLRWRCGIICGAHWWIVICYSCHSTSTAERPMWPASFLYCDAAGGLFAVRRWCNKKTFETNATIIFIDWMHALCVSPEYMRYYLCVCV